MSVQTDTGAFVQVPIWVLDAVGAGARDLYTTLLRYADNGGKATPSRTKLAKHMSCSTDTVDRRAKELVAAGALIITPRRDQAGDRTSNEWMVLRVRRGGRTHAATVAAPMRHELEVLELDSVSGSKEPSTAKIATKLQKELLWSAFEAEGVIAPKAKSPRAAFAKTRDELYDAGMTATDPRRVIRAYREKFPDMPVTIHAIAKWWQQLDADDPRARAAAHFARLDEEGRF